MTEPNQYQWLIEWFTPENRELVELLYEEQENE